MQTSLLGLAIAFIIALVAALIGPYFIDWNQFRPQFEAEAARALGAPVHVNGMLDARLLPTPTLRLRNISVGGQDAGHISADKLDVEFSLGALLRGEWRASELSLDGFSLDMGLDKQGRIESPLSSGRSNLGLLTIDRLSLAGRVSLHDAASGKSLDLADLKFTGDVRALAGTMRGEGEFKLLGARTPFRISSGQSADGKGTRLRFILDPGERALLADLDGILTFDALAPKFDGALTLAHSFDAKSPGAGEILPWRVASKIKASASSAMFEQVEVSYGPDDNALKFTGAGDMRFGASPLLHVAFAARQLDADRVFGKNAAGESLRVLAGLRRAIGAVPIVPFPAQIEVNVEQVALGGRPVQNIVVEMKSGSGDWTVGKFELRAPGVTRVAARGTIANGAFTGPVSMESAEPDALAAWLQGRNDINYGQRAIRLSGDAIIAADRVGISALKADIDGDMTGRVALTSLPDGKTSFEAALTSQSLNIDPANSLLAKLIRSRGGWPDEAKISLDIAKAIVAGQEIRPVAMQFSYSQNAIALDRLAIGDVSTVAINGSGSFDRRADGGKFVLTTKSTSLERMGSFLTPFAPLIADRLRAVETAQGDATLLINLDVDAPADQKNNLNVRARLSIDAPQVKGAMTLMTSAARDAATIFDLTALSRNDITIETKLASDKSTSMLALLGLDHIFSAQDGAAQFESSLAGRWGGAARIKANLSGAVDGDVQGTADVWSVPPKASLTLTLRRADASALFDVKPNTIASVSLSSRLTLENNIFTFDDLDANLGGSRVRGKIAATRADITGLNGEIGIDAINMSSVAALVFGAVGRDAAEPLGRGLLRGWRGSLTFQALKAELPGQSELRPFGGVLTSDGQSLKLESKGGIGGGEVSATADARQTPEGTSFNARVTLSDADGQALAYRGLALPSGKVSSQLTLTSLGRSAAALTGAMSGAGSITMKDMRIEGLDPAAFEVAVRASDDGKLTDDINLKAVVEPVLAAGAVVLSVAQIPFTMKDARLRVVPTSIQAARAQVTISGGYDLAADQTDIRTVLSANVVKPETGRPDIRIDLNGPPGKLTRTMDVASLSSWLAMRSIDRETRKLDQLERGVTPNSERELQPPPSEDVPGAEPIPKSEVRIPNRDPRRKNPNAKAAAPVVAPSPGAAAQVQPLPPPVNVKPAPAPAAAKPKPRAPVVLTPQAP